MNFSTNLGIFRIEIRYDIFESLNKADGHYSRQDFFFDIVV